jgi:hypothetical protein
MWAVDDTGRYSVRPSTRPNITATGRPIIESGLITSVDLGRCRV